jgi:secreted PhoX family phosphatase
MLGKCTLVVAVGLAFTPYTASAAPTLFSSFTPLNATAPTIPSGSPLEATPFVLSSPNFRQQSISDRATQIANGYFNSGNWDMQTANETGPDAGRYLFTPFETSTAGVQRLDRRTGKAVTLVHPGTHGFVAGDASRWTPWGTYLTAEESWSDPHQAASTKGRLFEITNPLAVPNDINFVHRKIGPADIRVSHEGLAFDKNHNFYFIDERDDSHIFRFTSSNLAATTGADFFASGVTSVLRVGDGMTKEATGSYSWVALTNAGGSPLSGTIVKTDAELGSEILDGRATPKTLDYLGTRFDRPEDMEIQVLPGGGERIYFTTTTNDKVFALDLANSQITLFADSNSIDMKTGLPVGSAFNSPDNLAIDAAGNMYIIEDQSNGTANIWFAKDADRNGVAEEIGVWATLQTEGAEPTGLYFDRFNPNVAYVNIQHPDSGIDRTIMITAVPEPETYAMMLCGLGMVGFALRRRQRKFNAWLVPPLHPGNGAAV